MLRLDCCAVRLFPLSHLVDVRVAGGEIQTTTLLGHPIDLTAFLGAINTLVDMHFPVMACEYRQAEPSDTVLENSGDRVVR
jgi:hypothetical protein